MIKSIHSSNQHQKTLQVSSISLTMSIISSIDGSFDQIYDHYQQTKKKKINKYEEPKEMLTINSIQRCHKKDAFQIKIKKEFPILYNKNNNRLIVTSSITVPYILSQLAQEVKYCLEKALEITFPELHQVILYKYSKKMDRFNIESKDALQKIKRRISEVLRVFQGANIVVISNKFIRITPHGKTNDLFSKELKLKRQKLEKSNQERNDLMQQKDKLLKVLSFLKSLQNRNQKDSLFKENSKMNEDNIKIFLPIHLSVSNLSKVQDNEEKDVLVHEIDNQSMILMLKQSYHHHEQ